jgi:hypothetical protein
MLEIKVSTRLETDGRTWLKCEDCGMENTFFNFPSTSCLMCYAKLPNARNLLERLNERIGYHNGEL